MMVFESTVQPFGGAFDRFAVEPGLGGEEIVRAALWQVKSHIEEKTAYVKSIWDERDEAFATEFEKPFRQTVLPTIAPRNYYTGQTPSLVEAPLEQWPSITIYAGQSTPAPAQPDQYDTMRIPLYVEVLCSFGPVKETELHAEQGIEAENAVWRICERLSSAVHLCIKTDPSLGGTLAGPIERPPEIVRSEPFARKADKGAGDFHIFAGRQLQYSTLKHTY